jgi:predicted ATPase
VFTEIELWGWRQFDHVKIQLHPRLTILTGANGAGKTTILTILAQHFGWDVPFSSTPGAGRKGATVYLSGLRRRRGRKAPAEPTVEIGRIGYESTKEARLTVPAEVASQFSIDIQGRQNQRGILIASHRPVYFYQRVERIPVQLDAREQLAAAYINEARDIYRGARPPSPSFRIKEALISLATFGYGNEAVDRNPEAVALFEGFEEILRIVLPPSLEFRGLRVHLPEVVLDTSSGPVSFDAMSGGIAALVDAAWQIYMYRASDQAPFCVAIDEPENHLHPELQRTIVPALMTAFPEAQFVISTHNPLVITSEPSSRVYVLRFVGPNRVRSELLDFTNKAATADETLMDVLGIPNTLPEWVLIELRQIIAKYAADGLTESNVAELRSDLRELGVGYLLPHTVADLVAAR